MAFARHPLAESAVVLLLRFERSIFRGGDGKTVCLSKLEQSPGLPWQRLCGHRFAIATEDIHRVEA